MLSYLRKELSMPWCAIIEQSKNTLWIVSFFWYPPSPHREQWVLDTVDSWALGPIVQGQSVSPKSAHCSWVQSLNFRQLKLNPRQVESWAQPYSRKDCWALEWTIKLRTPTCLGPIVCWPVVWWPIALFVNVYQINLLLIVPPLSGGFLLPSASRLLYSFGANPFLPPQIAPGMFKRRNCSLKFILP